MITLFSNIVESNQLSAILAFLTIAPPRSFTAKELSIRVKSNIRLVEKAILYLVKQGYVESFSKNHTKFYILNTKNPHITSLRTELLKSQKPWPDELVISLKKLGQLSGVFLSGIFVGQPQLPVDLLLVGKVSLSKLDKFLKSFYKQTGVELNYSIMSIDEFIDRRDTFDRFIKDIFDYPNIILLDTTKQPTTKNRTKKVK